MNYEFEFLDPIDIRDPAIELCHSQLEQLELTYLWLLERASDCCKSPERRAKIRTAAAYVAVSRCDVPSVVYMLRLIEREHLEDKILKKHLILLAKWIDFMESLEPKNV